MYTLFVSQQQVDESVQFGNAERRFGISEQSLSESGARISQDKETPTGSARM